jgi:hypothetical protein
MFDGSNKNPGTFAVVSFPLTASFVLGALAIVVILVFALCPHERETAKFSVETVTLAAGVLSAFYVGRGLRQTVLQRDQSLKDGQIAVACRFIERWNSPQAMDMKRDFREIIDSGKAHSPQYVEDLLERDKPKRTTVVEVLNFLRKHLFRRIKD